MTSDAKKSRRRAIVDALERRTLLTTLPSGFGEALVADGVTSPTAMAFAPDGRLFVAEKSGAVRVVKDGALLAAPFVTVTTSTFGERGLGGLAFDPDFETNHFVYVYYTAQSPTVHNRLSRFTADGDVALAGSETVLLDLPDVSTGTMHNGGAIQFAADGTLMLAVGDHSVASNAQSLSNPFGKLLRINPDGTIPSDNPFYNTTTGINRAIWSLGLRNPFTTAIDPLTGKIFINDVGQEQWEEINEAAAGANYGWPTTEGAFDPQAYPNFTNPIHAYPHSEGFAVTGGTFYRPASPQFPPQYVGKYFFADYVMGWIKYIDPTTHAVSSFGTDASAPVDLDVGPDGALYYLSRGENAVYRISATEAPQIVTHPASQLISVGEPVTFSVVASGATPLSYQWKRDGVDIEGATSSSYTIASTTLADDGAQFVCVVSNAQGMAASNAATLDVTTDQPPTPIINTPIVGTTFQAGQTINFSGEGSDNEDGVLSAANMTWEVVFHHNTHTHPFIAPFSGATGGSFAVPTTGETSANIWYRIQLTVTDSAGFVRSTYRDVQPVTANVTLQTNVPGLSVSLDGTPYATPITVLGVAGMTRVITAPPVQVVGGISYEFAGWSDGGAATHSIVFPNIDTTYTANYQPFTNYYLSDLDWTGTPTGGPMKDRNAFGNDITLDGIIYAKGIGVSANSQIIYNLGGAYERFISDVGRDDAWGDFGSVTFEVWVDGVKQFDSGVMTGATPRQTIDVDVTGANELKLIVTDAGDGAGSDQANWAGARLVNFAAQAPLTPGNLSATATNYNRVQLTWTDRSTNESGFKIERSTDGVNFTEIGTTAAGVGLFVDAPLSDATTYHYRVRASNAVGNSAYTPIVVVTTPAGTLPAIWNEADVGALSGARAGGADVAGSTYTIRGGGIDIGNEADEMHFVYRMLSGDGEIVARVLSIGPTHFDAKAGVMIRQSLDANSPSAFMYMANEASGGFLTRSMASGDSQANHTFGAPPKPRWVRLTRSGSTFSGYESADGVSWALIGTRTISMSGPLFVGLAVTASSATLINTSSFDNVTITNSAPTIAQAASAVLNAAKTAADLSVRGEDSDDDESGLIYTWSVIDKPAGALDPVFADNGSHDARDTTVTFGQAGSYTLRATITAGEQSVFSDVIVNVTATMTSVTVTPDDVMLAHGATQQFSATALDQFGQAISPQPSFTWSATGGGSIDSGGLYTAPAGDASVTITAAAGAIEGTASVIVGADAPFATLNAGVLVIDGTGGDDVLELSESGADVLVTRNGVTLAFANEEVESVLVHESSGSDLLEVNGGTFIVDIDSPQLAITVGAGAGIVFNDSVRLSSLTLDDATVTLDVLGGSIVTNSLVMSLASTLDLETGALIVHGGDHGSWTGSGYTGVSGTIAAGRSGGSWNGAGLTSSTAAGAGGATGLAIAIAGELFDLGGGATMLWHGETISADSLLVRYTWNGDADLDGDLDGDDYFWIDSHAAQSGVVFGYHRGDFDYDGDIDGDDYFLIDSIIALSQTQALY